MRYGRTRQHRQGTEKRHSATATGGNPRTPPRPSWPPSLPPPHPRQASSAATKNLIKHCFRHSPCTCMLVITWKQRPLLCLSHGTLDHRTTNKQCPLLCLSHGTLNNVPFYAYHRNDIPFYAYHRILCLSECGKNFISRLLKTGSFFGAVCPV